MPHDSGENAGADGGESAASGGNLHDVSLSLDAVLSLLAHRHRRMLLHRLADSSDQTTSIEECVSYLTARTGERTGERPAREHVETTLHHTHVPKLANAGILEYDARSREIRYRGHDRLEAWLERIRTHETAPD